MKINFSLINDFVSLVFPRVCVACNISLFKHEFYLCSYCKNNLPKANFHKSELSSVHKALYGRVPLIGAASYYLFSKNSKVQHVLHHVKYRNGKDLAVKIGEWMGYELNKHTWINSIDALVPIPLHPKKQIERGYNQSEQYAIGLSKETNIKVMPILNKTIYTSSQTKKNRLARWENVKDNFSIQADTLNLNHIALIDDVITTGATIESAYQALVNSGYSGKISVVSIAYASDLI